MASQESHDSPKADDPGAGQEEIPAMDVSSPIPDPKLGAQTEQEQAVEHHSDDVEPEGVDVPFLLKTALVGTVVLIVIVVLIIQFITLERQNQQFSAAQQAEFAEQRALEQESLQRLQSYGLADEEAGVYHVPIDRAIEYVVNERYGAGSTEE